MGDASDGSSDLYAGCSGGRRGWSADMAVSTVTVVSISLLVLSFPLGPGCLALDCAEGGSTPLCFYSEFGQCSGMCWQTDFLGGRVGTGSDL